MSLAILAAHQFADDTAYERLVLAHLTDTEQTALGRSSATVDVREPHNQLAIGLTESLSAGAVQDALRPFKPLAFGAAYKILDLLVELVMDLNGSSSGRRTMSAKQSFARLGVPAALPLPLDAAPQVWDRLARLYDTWLDMRHAIVHRRTDLRADGTLDRFDTSGSLVEDLPPDAQQHFIAAIHLVAQAIIVGSWDRRYENALSWHLDQLASHHGLSALKAHPPDNTVPKVVAKVEHIDGSHFRLDRKGVENRARAAFQSAHYLDLEIHADVRGGDDVYFVPLDELPTGDVLDLDLSESAWIARKVR